MRRDDDSNTCANQLSKSRRDLRLCGWMQMRFWFLENKGVTTMNVVPNKQDYRC